MNIAGVAIGGTAPCRVVAEVGNAHNGDPARMIRLLDAIKDAGADFAKFQCYTPDELVTLRGDGPAPDPWGSEGWSMRDLYTKAATPHDWFPFIVAYCRKIGLPWFSSVFGPESLALLESLGCPAYKIAALDADDEDLDAMVIGTGKPRVISLRQKTWSREDFPISTENELTLYCPEGYPQHEKDRPLDLTPMAKQGFDGLSYHGTRPSIPVQAAQLGAKLIEVHVHLLGEPSELESNVSLTEVQLAAVCAEVRG